MKKYGRPIGSSTKVLALKTKGKRRYWIKDDGKKHIGFSYIQDNRFPIGLYFTEMESIQARITNKTCDRFGCANGENGLY